MKRFIISIIEIIFVITPNKVGAAIPGIVRCNFQGKIAEINKKQT